MAKIVGSKEIVESVARIASNTKAESDNNSKPPVEEYPEGDLHSLGKRVLATLQEYQVKLRSGITATEENKKSSGHKQR